MAYERQCMAWTCCPPCWIMEQKACPSNARKHAQCWPQAACKKLTCWFPVSHSFRFAAVSSLLPEKPNSIDHKRALFWSVFSSKITKISLFSRERNKLKRIVQNRTQWDWNTEWDSQWNRWCDFEELENIWENIPSFKVKNLNTWDERREVSVKKSEQKWQESGPFYTLYRRHECQLPRWTDNESRVVSDRQLLIRPRDTRFE